MTMPIALVIVTAAGKREQFGFKVGEPQRFFWKVDIAGLEFR